MRRIALLALVVLIGAWAGAVVAPGVAAAAERATLTWDTDDTDVDLHIWDEFGNHAWYANQTGIPDSQLSTDIRFGFGPEHFEEFEGTEGRDYTYGVCYFTSNRDDGVVPDTTATITLTDPDGTQRTLRRVLHTAGEAYYLGTSPLSAPPFMPADDWCLGSTEGPYHPIADAGPDPTGAGGCTRTRRRIGVVDLCADEVTGSGSNYVAHGNVRADGGVSLGDGPFALDTDAKTITGTGAVQVVRGASLYPIVAGALTIDAHAATEPVSGRSGTAAISVAAATAQLGALKVAGLPLTPSPVSDGLFTLNLDAADGGGVIVQAGVRLPFAGDRASGSLAVGVHGASGAAVRVLGGSASFGDVPLPGGWGLSGFTLSYNEGTDSWNASGGLRTPAFGLDLSGGLADGRLDALGVAVSRDIPLGTTGFIISRLGGSVKGLAQPPLQISATAAGRWGSVPGLGVGLILLKDVTLTVDLSGSASLRGRVGFLYDSSPVNGKLGLAMRLSPFKASGSLETNLSFGPFSVEGDGSIAFTTSAFTAAGHAHGEIFGASIADGRAVLSNVGAGATGTVCAHPALFGHCLLHATLGLGMRWSDFPHVHVIGGDVQQFVTVSRAAGPHAIQVAPGRPFLIVEATGAAGTLPSFTLVDPAGHAVGSRRRTLSTKVVHDRARGYTAVMVLSPRSGRWRIRASGRGHHRTRFRAQTVRRVQRVHVLRVAPTGSRRHPVKRRGGAVRVGWTSTGLPRSTRVAVYVTRRPGQLGTRVAHGLRARGSVRIRGRRLARGANRVRLVVSVDGVPTDDVLARQVIRAR
jgi:hypothetical protein